jgi:hypothetical protein
MSEEDEDPPTPASLLRERLYSTVAVSLFLLLAAGLGMILLFEVPFRLLCGWAVHAWVTLPPLLPRWNELLFPLAALGLALFLTDRFIRWALAAKGTELRWQGRHTVSAGFLVLLGAAAAIAMSGIVHQMVWLGAEPWWGRGRGYQLTEAVSNARQIAVAIQEFERKNSRYPESLSVLGLPPNLLTVESRERGLVEPFVYLKPAKQLPAGEVVPVIVSPVLPDREKVCVAFLPSGDANLMQADLLPKLLDDWKRQSTAGHD